MPESGDNPFVHDWHGQTTLHPLGLTAVLLLGIALLVVPRRFAIWPIIAMVCLIAPAQRLVLLGADFTLLRLMVLFGTVRLLYRHEYRALRWRGLDTAIVVWTLASVLLPVVRIGLPILMNRLGYAYDAVGMYFLFRCLVREWDDVRGAVQGFMLMSIPVAGCFAIEATTGRNLFAVMGGVPEVTLVREGRLRCQGAFPHSILAGLYWASVLPLIVAHWWSGRRWLVTCASVACLFIVFASASASPLVAVLIAAIGGAAFYIRNHLKWLKWFALGLVVVLHMSMQAPVWHLISRIDLVGGSSGYHRYMLIDQGIKHLHEWWLIGSNVGTGHWGWMMHDVTNYYLVQGLHGGVLLLGLFVLLIIVAGRHVSRIWRVCKEEPSQLALAWGLVVALLVHVTNHLVISYFGQIWMSWYLLLATIGSLAVPVDSRSAVRMARPNSRRIQIVRREVAVAAGRSM